MYRSIQGEEKKRQIMSEFDPLTGGRVGNSISSPAEQVRQHFVPGATQAEGQLTERTGSTNRSVVEHDKGLWHQLPETPLPPTPEDESDSPTLKSVPAFPKQTSFLPIPEDVSGADSVDSMDLRNNRQVGSLHRFQGKNTWRTAVFTLLLLLIASGTVGIVLISRQNAALAGLKGTFFDSSKILLGLCIVLAIAFTVSFNIISRISLSTTRHEYAYTILWQLFCALLAPLFLLFDRVNISLNPQVLPLFALSIVLWALVDAFLFSAFKYEEVSVLSAIFPLNFLFTFVVSVVFFHSVIKPTIVVGFLIVMFASLLVGLYHTRFRPSKGIIFGLLYSFFLGVA